MISNLQQTSWFNRLHIDGTLLFFIVLILIYSVLVVWSASGQDISIIEHKIIQTIIGLLVMILIAQISPRTYEEMSPYLYVICVFLLVLVDTCGQISKGARRWLDLGFIRFQPSEIAKVAIPLIVARCINRNNRPLSTKNTIIVLILIFIPALLVAMQPDLGTAILIVASGLFVLFLSGVSWKLIVISALLLLAFSPLMWLCLMHDYQRNRIMTLIDPKIDPLGAGYHIIQSKIAIGSGGLSGKGWLHGTQSHLDFLPERCTDFIFAVLGEELGFIGILLLLVLYLSIIIRGLVIAVQAKNTFNRVISGSLILILFTYIFVNIGMVSGILPIVGIPLPLVSYGGSALIMIMTNFGIIMSVHTHQKMLSKNL